MEEKNNQLVIHAKIAEVIWLAPKLKVVVLKNKDFRMQGDFLEEPATFFFHLFRFIVFKCCDTLVGEISLEKLGKSTSSSLKCRTLP